MTDEIAERAAQLGLSRLEQIKLESECPWTAHWSARHGKGAVHLRAWVASCLADGPAVDRSAIDIEGDPATVALVRDVIAILPAAVAWRLVTGRVQIRCGRGLLPADVCGQVDVTRDPLRVDIADTADETTVAHELAHVFHLEPNIAWKGLDAEQRGRLRAALYTDVDEQAVDRFVDSTMDDERAADALASLWLRRPVDTTSGRLAEIRRQRLRAEFSRAAPTAAGSTAEADDDLLDDDNEPARSTWGPRGWGVR